MKSNTQPANWQNWAVFGIRVVLVLMIALVAYITRTEGGGTIQNYNEFIIAFAVGAVANVVLAILIVIKSAYPITPYAVGLGDWVLAGALAYLSGSHPDYAPLLAAGSAAVLGISGLLRLGMIGGSIHALGVLAITYGTLWFAYDDLQAKISAYVPTALIGLTAILGVGVWIFMRDEMVHGHQRNIGDVARQKDAEIQQMRENNRAIAEIITTLSSTLDYEKIMDKVLDVGRLSVKKRENNQRIVGMVLLYAADNETMRIANARGMTNIEMTRYIRGDQGIIGKTLREVVPVIAGPPHQDPQLREFVSFSNLKSSFCVPLRAGFDTFGALFFATNEANAFTDDNIETLSALATQATVAMQNAVLYNNLMAEKERILELEENARAELVRDLHDIPTQTVAAVTMRLRIIQRMLEKSPPSEIEAEVKAVEEMAQRASEEIRHVLFKLRPLILETKGLGAALEELATKTQKTYHQNITVKVGRDVEQYLDTNAQGGIFYLIEEAVNNARKYAKAEMITVVAARKNNYIVVRISDNGVGFDAGNASDQSIMQGSFGMTNMRERAELLNGTLKVESTPGKGTTITVILPIHIQSENGSRIHATVSNTKLQRRAKDRINGRTPA